MWADSLTRSLTHSLTHSLTRSLTHSLLACQDGVLVTSDGISRLAARDVLEELYDIRVDPEEFLEFTGMGEGVFLAGVASKYGVTIDVERTKAAFFEKYLSEYCDGSVDISFPGSAALVKACKDRGLGVAVASAADRVKVEGNLKAGRIDIDLFDVVVSADAFEGKLKPNPDIFLAASAGLQVAPENCVVIEDALAGVEAAKRAGMRCVAVSTTLSREKLMAGEYVPELVKAEIGEITVEDLIRI